MVALSLDIEFFEHIFESKYSVLLIMTGALYYLITENASKRKEKDEIAKEYREYCIQQNKKLREETFEVIRSLESLDNTITSLNDDIKDCQQILTENQKHITAIYNREKHVS